METALKKDIYEYMPPVWSDVVTRELGEEYVVPDTMPDVGEIVSTEAVLTIRGKETDMGFLQASATAAVSVVYAPEDGGGLRAMELTLPADVRMEAAAVDSDCASVVRMRLRGVEARAVNSRKLSVRGELETEAACYRRDSLQLASALEEPDAAHVLSGTAAAMLVTDVREKTFAVTDEYDFPSGLSSGAVIITRRVEAVVEDVKYVGGKVVFRGVVRSELLFSDPEGGVAAGRYETEFSQIMEAGDGESEAAPSISLLLTGIYFDLPEYGDEGKLQAEIHLAAQCVCRQRRELRYIADMYSNSAELVPSVASMEVLKNARPVSMRQTVVGRAEAAPAAGEVLRASVAVRSVGWEDGAVKTVVSARLLCRDAEGKYFSVRTRLNAEFTLPDAAGITGLAEIVVTPVDVYCPSLTDDIRVTLRMDALALEKETFTRVTSAEESEAPAERERTPSCTLVRVRAGADMWQLARRYRSTVEAIAAVNEGRTEGLLLIPKTR